MGIHYKIEDSLDWEACDRIVIKPKGWKEVTIHYIDSNPYVFWRINEINNNFRSMGIKIVEEGPENFFCGSLESLKFIVESSLDVMTEERREFYVKNIIGLFNE